MNALLWLKDQEVQDLLLFPLESRTGISLFSVRTPEEASRILQTSKVQILITDLSPPALSALPPLLQTLSEPLIGILCQEGSAAPPALPQVDWKAQVPLSQLLDSLVEKLNSLSGTSPNEVNPYYRVSTPLLMRLSPLQVGVHIRLSDTHYVKLFQQGDVFDAEDLKKYGEKKKIQFFFIPKENASVLVDRLSEELAHLLKGSPEEIAAQQPTIEDAIGLAADLANEIGVTKKVQKVITQAVQATLKTMEEIPDLNKIISEMSKNPTNYFTSHSVTTAHIACAIAGEMDWSSDQTFEKLTLAAFLHDATLKNSELCRIKSIEELEKKYAGKFTPQQIQDYKNHPQRAALMAAQFKELGSGVDKIIIQHHESPYGTGFPDGLNAVSINPLAAVFIVAHDLVDHIFDHEGEPDVEAFLNENRNKYASGNFKKIAQVIDQICFE